MKASKSGFDVKTTTQDHLAVDSSVSTIMVGDITLDGVTGFGQNIITITQGQLPTITITHNLGYVPLTAVYMETLPGDNKRFLLSNADSTQAPLVSMWATTVDTTNLYITKIGSQASEAGTYNYSYYIFVNQLV